jgi:long-chain acyl-CoA synthetase
MPFHGSSFRVVAGRGASSTIARSGACRQSADRWQYATPLCAAPGRHAKLCGRSIDARAFRAARTIPRHTEMHTIRDAVDAHADARAGAPFLLAPEPDAVIAYAALRESCRAFAALLDAHGVAPGGVVSFMLPNGVAAATVFVATMYAGRIVSPLNLIASDADVEYTLAHSGARLVFAANEHAERLLAIASRAALATTIVATDTDSLELPASADGELPPVAASDVAMLMYTSGTTGRPKGALLSHANMLAAGRAVAEWQQLAPSDRVLSSLPLYHVNGQCIATIAPLVSGGSIVMPHRFSASRWWPLVERYRPTWLNFVPTIIAYLLHGPDLTEPQAEAARGVQYGRSASAPLPPDQHRAFESRFGISVMEAMGLTECASVAFCNPLDPAKRRYGSPGLPLAMEARIVAPDGRVLGNGERGEIELRGANVMVGYYKSPEATASTIRPGGWLATGDLGYRDDDGFYYVTGRLKELIIKGGENIAPREIDEALLRHPAILEAAAVGVPDDDYGQEILGCVVLKPGAQCSEDALRAHCVAELGRYKTPRYFRFVDTLPKGPSGKVQRLKLARLVG